ncbi:MAG: hypothetical protein WCQ52_02770 [Actinomycetes bacterium]
MSTDPLLEEALLLLDDAAKANIPLVLVGGLAVRHLCPDFPPRHRDAQDLDLASISPARKALTQFLIERNYSPDKNFNALYGHKQLYFATPDRSRNVDILVDTFEMCHTLDFKDRIGRSPRTLDIDDLLLSKLQIVEINSKDVQDICYLLAQFPVTKADELHAVGLERLGTYFSSDWGWWKTVTLNIEKIIQLLDANHEGPAGPLVPTKAKYDVRAALQEILIFANEIPKSSKWKLRDKVGTRKKWYQEPEEVPHD